MSDARAAGASPQDRGHDVPTVTEADAVGDGAWFSANRRRYRLRRAAEGGGWLIRRRRGLVMLRVWAPSLPASAPDNDESLRAFWFLAAYPDLPAKRRDTLIKEARQSEHG